MGTAGQTTAEPYGLEAGRRASAPAGAHRSPAPATGHAYVLDLQGTAGNRATTHLIATAADGATAARGTDEVIRRGRRRGKARPRKRRAGRDSERQRTEPAAALHPEPPEPVEEDESWSAWFGRLASAGLGMVKPASADSGDAMVPTGGDKLEGTWGEFGADHEEAIDAESILGIPEVSITLRSGELKREIGGAEAEGAYELKRLLNGYEGTAKFEAKVGGSTSDTTGDYRIADGALLGTFTAETFVGAKVGAKSKGTLTPGNAVLRAEASAFAGMEFKGTTKVKVNVGGQQVATFAGGLGMSVGVGGEVKGQLSFAGGKMSIGSKGALAFGTGVAWEYKLDIDSPAVAAGLWTWASSWGSWLGTVAQSLDDALTDEDGEPIMIF